MLRLLFLVFDANYVAWGPPSLPVYLDILLHQVLAYYVVVFPRPLGGETRDTWFKQQSQGEGVDASGGDGADWDTMVAQRCPGAVTYSCHWIKTAASASWGIRVAPTGFSPHPRSWDQTGES